MQFRLSLPSRGSFVLTLLRGRQWDNKPAATYDSAATLKQVEEPERVSSAEA